MSDLADQSCRACRGGALDLLSSAEAGALLVETPGWTIEEGRLLRRFQFNDFHETMAFIDAMAKVAHAEDHHPDFEAGYNICVLRFVTHALGGLSKNDFICAAKINALLG